MSIMYRPFNNGSWDGSSFTDLPWEVMDGVADLPSGHRWAVWAIYASTQWPMNLRFTDSGDTTTYFGNLRVGVGDAVESPLHQGNQIWPMQKRPIAILPVDAELHVTAEAGAAGFDGSHEVGYWDFDGSTQRLLNEALDSAITSPTSQTMGLALWKPDTTTGHGYMAVYEAGTGVFAEYIGLSVNSGNTHRHDARNPFGKSTTTSPFPVGSWSFLAGTHTDAGAVQSWLESTGGFGTGPTAGAGPVLGRDSLTIGANDDEGTYGEIRASEAFVASRVLTNAELDEWAIGGPGGSMQSPLACSWASDVVFYLPGNGTLTSTANGITCTLTNEGSTPFVATGGPVVGVTDAQVNVGLIVTAMSPEEFAQVEGGGL